MKHYMAPSLETHTRTRRGQRPRRGVKTARRTTTPSQVAVKTLTKRVNELARKRESDLASHTYRERRGYQLTTTQGLAKCIDFDSVNLSRINTAISGFRYFNPATPGTLTTASLAGTTFSHDIQCVDVYSRCELRNNYQVPVKVRVYSLTPKHDTSRNAFSYYQQGIADQAPGLATTSALIFPTDIEMLNENWKIASSKSRELRPGQIMDIAYKGHPFKYDPSQVDSNTDEYQRKYSCHRWMVRVEGVLGHDATTPETMGCGVDVQITVKYVFHYDAGVALNDFTGNDDTDDTFAGTGVVSQLIADNQAFSST